MKTFYLVDVSSLIFRAFYAIRPLTSPKGLPVNAIYGFVTMTLKLLREEKPDYIVFCFDRPEETFRHGISAEYKANRSEMPEDLSPQMPYFRKIGEVLGIPCIDVKGFEADDVIGTLADIARKHELDVCIVSGDKDFAQLVDEHVSMYDTMKNVTYKAPQVKEKWGINPEQMIDYLSIVGDSSDNIKGVHGVGPKGAVKLLEEFGNLDGIYANIEKIKGATKEKLLASKQDAYTAQRLVTIRRDVPLSEELRNYELGPAHSAEVEALFEEFNFRTLRPTLSQLPNWNGPAMGSTAGGSVSAGGSAVAPVGGSTPETDLPPARAVKLNVPNVAPNAAPRISVGRTAVQLHEVVTGGPEQLNQVFAGDQNLWLAQIPSGTFLASEKSGKILQMSGELADWSQALDRSGIQFSGFNLKKMWHDLNLESPKAAWDSLLAAYVIRPGDASDWKNVSARWLQRVPDDDLSIQTHLQVQFEVRHALESELERLGEKNVYVDLELPLTNVLYQMEKIGVRLDVGLLKEQGQAIDKEIGSLEKKIHSEAGSPFNIGSPKQLANILFNVMKLPPSKKTKTGYSTDVDVLEKLRKVHPIAALICDYRELTKLKSTYVDVLPTLVKSDGRIHTTFNQALAVTGRLSSQDPNLQNIPIRTETGAAVRKAFVAEPNCELLSADYSQIELRILAHYSGDKNLSKAFAEDLDVHALTAAEVFGVEIQSVSPEQRRSAKAINFGIAYGQGAFGLAENLGITRNEAQDIITRYFARFPGVAQYIQSTIETAKGQGYVETLMGRKRFLEELRSANPTMRKFGERAAINAPIQGTAADIIKKAMIDIFPKIKAKMVLQVHDELLFEGTHETLESESVEIKKAMENAVTLKVPMKVNAATGKNWQEAH